MSFIEPADTAQLDPDTAAVLEQHRRRLGFIPNIDRILAHNEEVLRVYADVTNAGLYNGALPKSHRFLVAAAASGLAGCRYCEGHLTVVLRRDGVGVDEIQYALGLRPADGIDPAFVAIVEFGWAAASVPSSVSAKHFAALRNHFRDVEIIELGFVAALFGFLHRVNALMGTTLEAEPYEESVRLHGELGWDPGLHGDGSPNPIKRSPHPYTAAGISPQEAQSRAGRIDMVNRASVPELEPEFADFERRSGYVPNSMLILAHRPDLVRVMSKFFRELTRTRTIPADLAFMCAWISSYASGCQYCQAHTSLHSYNFGASTEKVEALWTYSTSPLFSDAERTALDLAMAAAGHPTSVTQELIDNASQHFSSRQLIDLILQIGVFGFLNRWNDMFATALEESPGDFAANHLSDSGWTGGKHVARSST